MSRIDEIEDKVRALIDAQYCCDELADAAESWLDSIETDQFEEETERFMEELDEDILPIDDLIHYCEIRRPDWFSSKEEADQLLQEAWEIKENGGQYCNCEACSLSLEILSMLGEEI